MGFILYLQQVLILPSCMKRLILWIPPWHFPLSLFIIKQDKNGDGDSSLLLKATASRGRWKPDASKNKRKSLRSCCLKFSIEIKSKGCRFSSVKRNAYVGMCKRWYETIVIYSRPVAGREFFLSYRKPRFYMIKTLREVRTASVWKHVAKATRRRRRISQER